MPINGITGIAQEFNVSEETVKQCIRELIEDWDNWMKWWEENKMPQGLGAISFVWSSNFKKAIETLTGEDADLMHKIKVAITLDNMID